MQKILGLAPMDGITNCSYRTITQELFEKNNSAPDRVLWLWTEFMNVEGFAREPGKLIHHIMKTDFEKNTIAQIYGSDENDLLEAAKFIDQGMLDIAGNKQFFAGIELNIGCPSPKVMSCGGGAGMMRDRDRTLQIIKNISSNIHLPFSIKTRTGLNEHDRHLQKEFILAAAPYCKRIVIHGRTYKQSHTGNVDWDFIHEIKKELGETCVVIGNGGIRTYEQAIEILGNETSGGLDGVMLGQAALGRPWIFTGNEPTLEERYTTIVRHAQMMIILYDYYFARVDQGRSFVLPTYDWLTNEIRIFDASKYEHEKTLIEYRKYIFNYISGLPGNRDLKVQLAHTKKYDEMIAFVDAFFEKVGKEATNQ